VPEFLLHQGSFVLKAPFVLTFLFPANLGWIFLPPAEE
jgi:hypothetical protein